MYRVAFIFITNMTNGHSYKCSILMLQVILAIGVVWSISAILTAFGVFPEDPQSLGYGARADAKIGAIEEAAWIRVPYPCELRKLCYCLAKVLRLRPDKEAHKGRSISSYGCLNSKNLGV